MTLHFALVPVIIRNSVDSLRTQRQKTQKYWLIMRCLSYQHHVTSCQTSVILRCMKRHISSKDTAVLMPSYRRLVRPLLEQHVEFPSLVFKTDEFRWKQEGPLITETNKPLARGDDKFDSFSLGKTSVYNDCL